MGNPTSGDQNESAHTERRGDLNQDHNTSNMSNEHGNELNPFGGPSTQQTRILANPSSYFDNAQDEATGGEGHSNIVMEEEKQSERPNDQINNHQVDQQSALGQDRA